MVKKSIIQLLLLCIFLCRASICAAQVYQTQDSTVGHAAKLDSSVCKVLNGKLMEYFEAIKHEPVDVQKEECDFLIGSANDSLIRDYVAQTIYDHYLDSPVMGFEAVSIHIYDNWFRNGKANMRSDMDMLGARIFAEFNRQSLIGCKAPELSMTSLDGQPVDLFTETDRKDRFRVLYFYDTDCVKCRMQSILLANVLATEAFPVDFYAVYTGDDRHGWEEYVSERFDGSPSHARIFHLWDPEIDSDFQRKYAVLQTPRLYLVTPDGTIKGRGLDALALTQMLHGIFDEVKLDYGSKESDAMFDGIFAGGTSSSEDVMSVADHIASSTLPKGDTVIFRQMTGDLLYYLSSRSGEAMKEGLDYLIDSYILSNDKVWRSQDDSLKVVGFAQIMDDLLDKAAPGSSISGLKVPGTLVTSKREKQTSRRLNRIGGRRNIIIFYTEGCNICDAEKAAARRLLNGDAEMPATGRSGGEYASHLTSGGYAKLLRHTRIFMVNVDEILRKDPSMASHLFDSFDLSSLPFLIETDRKGTIQRRYLSLQ